MSPVEFFAYLIIAIIGMFIILAVFTGALFAVGAALMAIVAPIIKYMRSVSK